MQQKVFQLKVGEPDGTNVQAPVKCSELGNGRFRVEAIPYSIESLNFGDEFEGELKGGLLHVIRIVRRSGWRTNYFVMQDGNRNPSWLPSVEAKVDELGGLRGWFCGLLVISLPPHVEYDPLLEMRRKEI